MADEAALITVQELGRSGYRAWVGGEAPVTFKPCFSSPLLLAKSLCQRFHNFLKQYHQLGGERFKYESTGAILHANHNIGHSNGKCNYITFMLLLSYFLTHSRHH